MWQSTKRLSQMTSAMFELSIGRRVKRLPNLAKGEIRDCVEQAIHEATPISESKKLSLSVNLEYALGSLYFQASQIEQVLVNLLDNACKFTPQRGSIEIRGYPFFWERRGSRSSSAFEAERRKADSAEPNSYRIDIRGSGPLIPAELMGKIFEEYTSYGGGQDRSGGGLGLAICRMILSAHEGKVWAENTDEGPRFSFVLPTRTLEPSGDENGTRQPQLIQTELM
jgi:two-component system clock-associated histidine kinase SasA